MFVAIGPFTHMIWLECLPAKGGKNVFSAFVNRILLEEGAPRIIRCDNGTEFKSSMLNDLCRELNVHRCSSRPLIGRKAINASD